MEIDVPCLFFMNKNDKSERKTRKVNYRQLAVPLSIVSCPLKLSTH